MSVPREPMRRVVVAGGGQLGVLSAFAIRSALPQTEVVVIGVPEDRAAFSDRIGTALPFTNRLHDRLGIDESDLVRRAGATHRLALNYFGWSEGERNSLAPYGAAIDPRLKTAFARDWGGGPRNAATASAVGSVGEALARAGKFIVPDGAPDSPLADVDYGLRWHVPAYRDLLSEKAQKAGVQYVRGRIGGVKPDGRGGILAVGVEGVGAIEADLFVDCTGAQALLLSRLPGYSADSWTDWLPERRLAAIHRQSPMTQLFDRVELTEHGWLQELAGRDGQLLILGAVPGLPHDRICEVLGGEPNEFIDVIAGRSKESWRGNVVALGEAAAVFEPLGWLNLDLAHRQLNLLLELLPGQEILPDERDEYNRRSGMMADRARDIVASHYASPAAVKVFGEVAQSEELSRVLDQYRRRGRLPFLEDSPMLTQEWAVLLQALGLAQGERTLDRSQEIEAGMAARDIATKCEAALRVAPAYEDWLRTELATQPPAA